MEDSRLVNGEMIVLAREFRGMQAKELADALNISPSLLSLMERSSRTVSDDHVHALCRVLRFKSSFFCKQDYVYPANLHWRKNAKASARAISKADAEMNIHRLNIEQFLKSVAVTQGPLPVYEVEEYGPPEVIAKAMRQLWQVPKGPIRNLFNLIELHGVIIVPCDFESTDIDGRGMYTKNKTPIIFLNRNRTMDRQRFTVLHELGHFIMHMGSMIPSSRDTEKEAHRFASEFLAPSDQVRVQIQGRLTLDRLADLKLHWRMSMQALLYKAHEEEMITPYNWKSLIIEMGKRGLKTREPVSLDAPTETPQLLERMVQLHQEALSMSASDIGDMCGVSEEFIRDAYLKIKEHKIPLMYKV